ncbi:MAG TPA: hypothetical protein VNK04_22235 [Gemmataceae bacterium]|nr:hypothetical protein [Gemmataceae bacterium]
MVRFAGPQDEYDPRNPQHALLLMAPRGSYFQIQRVRGHVGPAAFRVTGRSPLLQKSFLKFLDLFLYHQIPWKWYREKLFKQAGRLDPVYLEVKKLPPAWQEKVLLFVKLRINDEREGLPDVATLQASGVKDPLQFLRTVRRVRRMYESQQRFARNYLQKLYRQGGSKWFLDNLRILRDAEPFLRSNPIVFTDDPPKIRLLFQLLRSALVKARHEGVFHLLDNPKAGALLADLQRRLADLPAQPDQQLEAEYRHFGALANLRLPASLPSPYRKWKLDQVPERALQEIASDPVDPRTGKKMYAAPVVARVKEYLQILDKYRPRPAATGLTEAQTRRLQELALMDLPGLHLPPRTGWKMLGQIPRSVLEYIINNPADPKTKKRPFPRWFVSRVRTYYRLLLRARRTPTLMSRRDWTRLEKLSKLPTPYHHPPLKMYLVPEHILKIIAVSPKLEQFFTTPRYFRALAGDPFARFAKEVKFTPEVVQAAREYLILLHRYRTANAGRRLPEGVEAFTHDSARGGDTESLSKREERTTELRQAAMENIPELLRKWHHIQFRGSREFPLAKLRELERIRRELQKETLSPRERQRLAVKQDRLLKELFHPARKTPAQKLLELVEQKQLNPRSGLMERRPIWPADARKARKYLRRMLGQIGYRYFDLRKELKQYRIYKENWEHGLLIIARLRRRQQQAGASTPSKLLLRWMRQMKELRPRIRRQIERIRGLLKSLTGQERAAMTLLRRFKAGQTINDPAELDRIVAQARALAAPRSQAYHPGLTAREMHLYQKLAEEQREARMLMRYPIEKDVLMNSIMTGIIRVQEKIDRLQPRLQQLQARFPRGSPPPEALLQRYLRLQDELLSLRGVHQEALKALDILKQGGSLPYPGNLHANWQWIDQDPVFRSEFYRRQRKLNQLAEKAARTGEPTDPEELQRGSSKAFVYDRPTPLQEAHARHFAETDSEKAKKLPEFLRRAMADPNFVVYKLTKRWSRLESRKAQWALYALDVMLDRAKSRDDILRVHDILNRLFGKPLEGGAFEFEEVPWIWTVQLRMKELYAILPEKPAVFIQLRHPEKWLRDPILYTIDPETGDFIEMDRGKIVSPEDRRTIEERAGVKASQPSPTHLERLAAEEELFAPPEFFGTVRTGPSDFEREMYDAMGLDSDDPDFGELAAEGLDPDEVDWESHDYDPD